jgi:hypothetical protein
MCQAFFDVRMFGAVMTTGKALCGRVQGPVQLGFSRSVGPVLAQEHGLTRITHTGQEDIDDGESTEMASKHAIPYGLYLGNGHFSAPLDGEPGRVAGHVDPGLAAAPPRPVNSVGSGGGGLCVRAAQGELDRCAGAGAGGPSFGVDRLLPGSEHAAVAPSAAGNPAVAHRHAGHSRANPAPKTSQKAVAPPRHRPCQRRC